MRRDTRRSAPSQPSSASVPIPSQRCATPFTWRTGSARSASIPRTTRRRLTRGYLSRSGACGQSAGRGSGRAVLAAWFLCVGMLPRTAAAHVAAWRLGPTSRPVAVNRLASRIRAATY